MGHGQPMTLDGIKAMKREITRALILRGRPPLEGSTSPEELLYLATTAQRSGVSSATSMGPF